MNCPTCGRPIPEGQRFCGNCGTDVQAVGTYNPGSTPPPPPGSTDAAYDYEEQAYEYAPAEPRRVSIPLMWLLLAIVAIICLCCGLILGALGMYWLGPTPPSPATNPPPSTWMILFHV